MKRTPRETRARWAALLLLLAGLLCPLAPRGATAQGGAEAPKVKVTLVRWPYT